jgi:hypothetical protein
VTIYQLLGLSSGYIIMRAKQINAPPDMAVVVNDVGSFTSAKPNPENGAIRLCAKLFGLLRPTRDEVLSLAP